MIVARKEIKCAVTLFLLVCFCSLTSGAGEVRFNKGKLWLSRNTLKTAEVQRNQSLAHSVSEDGAKASMMSMASNREVGNFRVFDLSVAMWRERTAEERKAFGIIFTNFAYAVYEATDGHHKIGRITILDKRHAGTADVSWEYKGRVAHSQINTADRQGRVTMYDYSSNVNGLNAADCVKLGFTLAHEWSHGIYGLLDEYAQESENADHSNSHDPNPHADDVAVAPSMMNRQNEAVGGNWEWLNYSTAYKEGTAVCGAFMNTGKTAQHRAYGQSCWEQLRSPQKYSNWNWTDHFFWWECWSLTTPDYPEFKDHSVTDAPTIEMDKLGAAEEATSELEIIWGVVDTEVAIAIDVSGSMASSDVANVKARAQELVARAPVGTIMSVTTFNTSIKTIFPFTEIEDGNREELQSKIAAVANRGRGGTALWDTAWKLLSDLESRDFGGVAVRSLLLLTDGIDENSSHTKADVVARCNSLGIALNAVAYGNGADSSLKSACDATGGQYYVSTQDAVSLSQAFFRSFAYSSSLETLVDVYYPTVSAPISQSFAVDSTLTNLQMSVVVSKGAESDEVVFVDPTGALHTGTKMVTGTQATYMLGVETPAVGEWKINATLHAVTAASVYADAGSVAAGVRVSTAVDESGAKLGVMLDLGNSIEGAKVTACVPCESGVREVAFEECGYGCYELPIVRCGADVTNHGVTVRCEMRKGEAHLNLRDGLVSPAPDTEDDSISEDFVRAVHFSVSDLANALTNVVFDTDVFSAKITGIALAPDHVNYDPSKLSFVDPSTPLTVPYGTSVIFRVSYDYPDGYKATVWTRDCYADGAESYAQYFGSNPSAYYQGKGVAYGFLVLREDVECPTIQLLSVAVRSKYSTATSESSLSEELSRAAVNLTFEGTPRADLDPCSDFSAEITGIALVSDHENYNPAKLSFVDPATPLTVPYGTSVIFRVSYDYPDGYSATVWTRDRYADGDVSYSQYFGSNPSAYYKGKGVAYGFLVLRKDVECPTFTLKAAAVRAGFSPVPEGCAQEMDISRTTVNLTFLGTPQDDDQDPVGSPTFAAEITGVALASDYTSYDPAKLTFVDPATPLTVPYGTSVIFRVNYDYPDGYTATVWTRDRYEDGAASYCQYFGSNPSRYYKGKGVAYGFLVLRDDIECPTINLKIAAVRAGFSPVPEGFSNEKDLSRVAVNLTFEGTPKDDPGQNPDPSSAVDGTYTQTVNGVEWVYTIKDGIAILGYNPAVNYTPGAAALPVSTSGKVIVPSSFEGCPLEKIGADAFHKCVNLTEIVIPDSVTAIERYAFFHCQSLEKLELPPRLVSIGWCALTGCESLMNVEIPASVTSIDSNPFGACTELQNINVQAGNASYLSKDGVLLSKDGETLIAFPGGRQEVALPQGVTKLGYESFYGVATRQICVPETVKEIETWAFGYSQIEEIEFGSSLSKIPSYACIHCQSLTDVVLCEGVSEIGESAFGSCSSLERVSIPKSVKTIEKCAFGYCSKLSCVDFAGDPPAYTDSAAFQDVQDGCRGMYSAECAATWQRVLDSEGKWKGLKMEISSAAGQLKTSLSLSSGWNWVSLNVAPEDAAIGTVLASATFLDGDVVKSASGLATCVGGKWYGELSTFTPGVAYMIKKSTSGTDKLTITGEAAAKTVDVKVGWNWIGPTVAEEVSLDALTHSVGFVDGDVIKSADSVATYVGGKWYGELKSLKPGVGYKARFANGGTLTFGKGL